MPKKEFTKIPVVTSSEITGGIADMVCHVLDRIRPNPIQSEMLQMADLVALALKIQLMAEFGVAFDLEVLATLLAVYPVEAIGSLAAAACTAYAKNPRREGSPEKGLEKRLLRSHCEQLKAWVRKETA